MQPEEKSPVLLHNIKRSHLLFRFVKRFIDLAFAVGVLLFFWWGLLVIWILVRLQTSGPGIFAQERVGHKGRIFTCYKFRTMHTGTAQAGTHEVAASSVTKLGVFLRKTKLDELPQIWNILKNELSLIGPRPCLPSQAHLVEIRRANGVFELKPGISGLAQINNVDMSNPEKLLYWDVRYLQRQSLKLDLKIILQTALGGGQGDKIIN
jgi:lipopolysaccharide/colanic/teichoic acid biosynthesis glycosyltransferase